MNESTTDTQKAASAVMLAVSDLVPKIDKATLHKFYEYISATWGSKALIEGDFDTVQRVIAENLARLRQRSGFISFDVDAMPKEKCAQVSIV